MTKTSFHSGDRVLLSILIWSGRTSPPHYSTVSTFLLWSFFLHHTRPVSLSPVVATAVLLYFTEEGALILSSFPSADQVIEVERLPRSGVYLDI